MVCLANNVLMLRKWEAVEIDFITHVRTVLRFDELYRLPSNVDLRIFLLWTSGEIAAIFTGDIIGTRLLSTHANYREVLIETYNPVIHFDKEAGQWIPPTVQPSPR